MSCCEGQHVAQQPEGLGPIITITAIIEIQVIIVIMVIRVIRVMIVIKAVTRPVYWKLSMTRTMKNFRGGSKRACGVAIGSARCGAAVGSEGLWVFES